MRNARELVSDPLVLRAAWRRIRRWLAGADWTPQPDATIFALTVEEQLPEIGAALGSGDYRPEPFKVIAYPKSGGALRHFAVATTRDQVAFAVLAVLLGPLIDMALPNFVFGNRWYRALFREREPSGARWRHRPYALDSAYFYQPYRRDFSLFRRSANWAASVMVGRDVAEDESIGKPFKRDDFVEAELPECCRPSWWTGGSGPGYWGRLDLRLAYPSVRLPVLATTVADLLDSLTEERVVSALRGYPRHIALSLAQPRVRRELSTWLCDALSGVRYDAGVIADLWVPAHIAHDVPRAGHDDHPGIPTGLAVSGVLLNAYLHDFDWSVDAWLRARPAGGRAAVLRFADDIIVLGQSPTAIAETLDAVWRSLERRDDAILAAPNRMPTSMNFRVNWSKVEPESLREKVVAYLQAHAWVQEGDATIEPAQFPQASEPFARWLEQQGDPTWLDSSQIARDRIGPFVTHLVERMSTLGGENLDDRFGRGAKTRLDELHQLLRLEIEDPHVRNDTRLAFAANKIVRAFIPDEGSPTDAMEIAAIRNSVGEAVLRVPWKFSLWRSVVHAACRRPLVAAAPDERLNAEHEQAKEWLTRLLRRIGTGDEVTESWLRRWPEKKTPTREVRGLYLSFLRSQFWLAVASSIRDLRRIGARDEGQSPRHWSPSSWTFRAVDERRSIGVLTWLSQVDVWANVLYGAQPPDLNWWERDALASVALSLVDATTAPAAEVLSITDGALEGQPRVVALLANAARVAPTSGDDGSAERWAHVALAKRPARRVALVALAAELYSKAGSSKALAWASVLGLPNFLKPEAADAIGRVARSLKRAPTLPKLEEYRRTRRLELAFVRLSETVRRWTIHRLLWSIPNEENAPTLWPAAAPVVGLPPRLALRLFLEALSAEFGNRSPAGGMPVWTLSSGRALWDARNRQLSSQAWQPLITPSRLVRLGTKWDVRPHGAYYLPAAIAVRAVDPVVVRIWSHVLQFLTAAQGDESFLEQILAAWPQPAPLEERWSLRAAVPLAVPIWRLVDQIIAGALSNDPARVRDAAREIINIAPRNEGDVVRDFDWDRVDVKLSLDGGELAVGCVPFEMKPPTPSGELALRPDSLAKDITVTIAQISAHPDWTAYQKAYFAGAPPSIPRGARQQIMAQVAASFATRPGTTVTPDGPILFPEVTLPLEEENSFRTQALAHRRAALAGLQWNVVPFAAVGNANALPQPPRRYLVNEAVLIAPVSHASDPGVLHPRVFRIRKPLPTHQEHSLAETLGAPPHPALGSTWTVLPGTRWYRFVDPRYGDFTVAICSDILDPSPWKSLQGQILHLFLVSYNQDVQLYESLTWLRAYETYANVIATNHGSHGGSFAWTPRSSESKEVARLRGEGLFVVADIKLEVSDLASQQRTGVNEAVERGKKSWTEVSAPKKPRWKSPPPGYRVR